VGVKDGVTRGVPERVPVWVSVFVGVPVEVGDVEDVPVFVLGGVLNGVPVWV